MKMSDQQKEYLLSFYQSLVRPVRPLVKLTNFSYRWQAGWLPQMVPGVRHIPTNETVIFPVVLASPLTDVAPQLLQLLEHHQLQVTFAIHADEAIKNGDLLQKILKAGHRLANRSFSLTHRQDFSPKKSLRAIRDCSRIIQQLTNAEPLYWMPDDDSSSLQRRWAVHLGMTVIDPAFWLSSSRKNNLKPAFYQTAEKLKPGLILGVSVSQNLENSLSQLDSLLTRLQFTGWKAQPLPERSVPTGPLEPEKTSDTIWSRSA